MLSEKLFYLNFCLKNLADRGVPHVQICGRRVSDLHVRAANLFSRERLIQRIEIEPTLRVAEPASEKSGCARQDVAVQRLIFAH